MVWFLMAAGLAAAGGLLLLWQAAQRRRGAGVPQDCAGGAGHGAGVRSGPRGRRGGRPDSGRTRRRVCSGPAGSVPDCDGSDWVLTNDGFDVIVFMAGISGGVCHRD